MGKLVVTEFISLDGIIEDPGGSEGTPQGGWSFRFPIPGGEQFKFDELLASDVQLLGRVTYEGFAAAWPGMEEAAGEFGKRMNSMPKVVVSTTLAEPASNNTTVISGDVAAGTELELTDCRKVGPDVLLLTYRPVRRPGDESPAS